MRKVTLVFGVFFIVLAVIVLLFAHGLRRWYSGIFFLLIGIVSILSARVRKEPVQE